MLLWSQGGEEGQATGIRLRLLPKQNSTDWMASTNRSLVLTVLEAGGPRSRCWGGLFLAVSPLGSQVAAFSLCPHMAFSLWVHPRYMDISPTGLWSFMSPLNVLASLQPLSPDTFTF